MKSIVCMIILCKGGVRRNENKCLTLVPIIITERKTDNIWVNGDPQKIARSQPQFREVNERLQDWCVGVGRV